MRCPKTLDLERGRTDEEQRRIDVEEAQRREEEEARQARASEDYWQRIGAAVGRAFENMEEG